MNISHSSSDTSRSLSLKWQILIILSLLLVGLVFLLRSISVPDMFFDEVFYIWLAQAQAWGHKPFLEVHSIMNTGSVPAIPVLWIAQQFFGYTTGIWLFSRIAFFLGNLLIAFWCYKSFKSECGKWSAILIASICAFYAALHPCFFYNSTGSIFACLGALFLFKNLSKPSLIYAVLAGVSFAIMTYGYPTMLPLIAYFAVLLYVENGASPKNVLRSVLGMVLGGGLVVALFAFYITFFYGWAEFLGAFQSCFGEKAYFFTEKQSTRLSLGRIVEFLKVIISCYAYLLVSTAMLFGGIVTTIAIFTRKFIWHWALLESVHTKIASTIMAKKTNPEKIISSLS